MPILRVAQIAKTGLKLFFCQKALLSQYVNRFFVPLVVLEIFTFKVTVFLTFSKLSGYFLEKQEFSLICDLLHNDQHPSQKYLQFLYEFPKTNVKFPDYSKKLPFLRDFFGISTQIICSTKMRIKHRDV